MFYPSRNSKLLKSLADEIGNVVRRQSGTPKGGSDTKVVTYEDLLKDPDVMVAVKNAYGIVDEDKLLEDGDENDVLVDGKPRWSGKTMYDLFKAEIDRQKRVEEAVRDEVNTKEEHQSSQDSSTTLSSDSSSDTSSDEEEAGSPPPLSEPADIPVIVRAPSPEQVEAQIPEQPKEQQEKDEGVVEVESLADQENVITVQRCVLEHQPLQRPLSPPDEFKGKSDKDSTTTTIASNLGDLSTSGLKAQERQRSEDREDHVEQVQVVDVLPPALAAPFTLAPTTSVLRDQDGDSRHPQNHPDVQGEQGLITTGLLAWLDHPAFLAACYCLAIMHHLGQHGGLDFLSMLGMVLAMISMVSMLFL